MQTRVLRTLVMIARVGSFARAADELHMTVSGVSMQMKALETQLGVDIFDRSFRPPKLTPGGRQVAAHAVDLLAAEERLLGLSRGDESPAGRFQIGFVATAGVRLLPDFLLTAAEAAPGARFDVEVDVSEVLEAKVANGLMDAAVITAPESPNPTLELVTLRDEDIVFAVPRVRADDGTLPFIQFAPDVGIGKLIARYMARYGPASWEQATLVLNGVEAIMECVKRGIGYTLLPEPDVRRCADNDLVVITKPQEPLSRQLAFATMPTGPVGRQLSAFVALFARRADF